MNGNLEVLRDWKHNQIYWKDIESQTVLFWNQKFIKYFAVMEIGFIFFSSFSFQFNFSRTKGKLCSLWEAVPDQEFKGPSVLRAQILWLKIKFYHQYLWNLSLEYKSRALKSPAAQNAVDNSPLNLTQLGDGECFQGLFEYLDLYNVYLRSRWIHQKTFPRVS